jgi:hypothetical protein
MEEKGYFPSIGPYNMEMITAQEVKSFHQSWPQLVMLIIVEPYGPPRPVTGIALPLPY